MRISSQSKVTSNFLASGESERIVILGAGGVGLEIAEFLPDFSKNRKIPYALEGFLDDDLHNPKFSSLPLLDRIDNFNKYEDVKFISSIGSAHDTDLRMKVFDRISRSIDNWGTLIHPQSTVANSAVIEPGVLIYPGCRIGSNVNIGRNTLIAYNSTVAHESVIGEHSVIASGVSISGEATIGRNTYLAPGCVIAHGVRIGDNCMIGIGSVVDSEVKDGTRLVQKSRDFRIPNHQKEIL